MINKTKEKLILIGMPGSGKLQLVNFWPKNIIVVSVIWMII